MCVVAELEARQKFDAMQRMYSFMSQYGTLFDALAAEFGTLRKELALNMQKLEDRKSSWEVDRANVDVAEILQDQMAEIAIARQGYVDVETRPHAQVREEEEGEEPSLPLIRIRSNRRGASRSAGW